MASTPGEGKHERTVSSYRYAGLLLNHTQTVTELWT